MLNGKLCLQRDMFTKPKIYDVASVKPYFENN